MGAPFPGKYDCWNPSAKNQTCIEHNFTDGLRDTNSDLGYRPASPVGIASRHADILSAEIA
jgi:hypothetical protein